MEQRLNQCQNIPGNFITKGTERLQLKAKKSFSVARNFSADQEITP